MADFVHGIGNDIDLRTLDSKLFFRVMFLVMWNLASKDERDGTVSSPKRQQPQKAQQAMAQVAACNGSDKVRCERRVWRWSRVIGLLWGREKFLPSLFAVDLVK